MLGTDYTIYNSTSFTTDLATKDTDDITEGSTNLFSQWTRFIDGAQTGIRPTGASDQIVLGPITSLTSLGSISAAKAIFSGNAESTFFATTSHAAAGFVDAGGFYTGARSFGTADAPTAITARVGLAGFAGLGHDGTNYATSGDGRILPALYIQGEVIGTGNVRQYMELLGGINQSTPGVIRLTTQNYIGFYGADPVARSTGWNVTNVTTDKAYNANSTTIDELADVLGTLINQLKTIGLLAA